MFEIKLVREPYNYGEIGSQSYNSETIVHIPSDTSGTDVIKAIVELMRYATFSDTTIIASLKEVLDELQYDKESEARLAMYNMKMEDIIDIANKVKRDGE